MAAAYHLIEVSETVSTNADAMRLARAGEALPLWVRADRQTAGRGRIGRAWASADGNLFTSVALRSTAPLSQAGELALVAGNALYDAVLKVAPHLPMRLKWPNDLLLGGAKAAGILVETATDKDGFLAIIGFGLNVVSHPNDVGQPATSLNAHDVRATAADMAAHVAEAFAIHLTAWDDGRGFRDRTRPDWMAKAGPLDQVMTVSTATERLTGMYKGVNRQGHLLLHTDNNGEIAITHGDVALTETAREST